MPPSVSREHQVALGALADHVADAPSSKTNKAPRYTVRSDRVGSVLRVYTQHSTVSTACARLNFFRFELNHELNRGPFVN